MHADKQTLERMIANVVQESINQELSEEEFRQVFNLMLSLVLPNQVKDELRQEALETFSAARQAKAGAGHQVNVEGRARA